MIEQASLFARPSTTVERYDHAAALASRRGADGQIKRDIDGYYDPAGLMSEGSTGARRTFRTPFMSRYASSAAIVVRVSQESDTLYLVAGYLLRIEKTGYVTYRTNAIVETEAAAKGIADRSLSEIFVAQMFEEQQAQQIEAYGRRIRSGEEPVASRWGADLSRAIEDEMRVALQDRLRGDVEREKLDILDAALGQKRIRRAVERVERNRPSFMRPGEEAAFPMSRGSIMFGDPAAVFKALDDQNNYSRQVEELMEEVKAKPGVRRSFAFKDADKDKA